VSFFKKTKHDGDLIQNAIGAFRKGSNIWRLERASGKAVAGAGSSIARLKEKERREAP
jgi:hypothetical protein